MSSELGSWQLTVVSTNRARCYYSVIRAKIIPAHCCFNHPSAVFHANSDHSSSDHGSSLLFQPTEHGVTIVSSEQRLFPLIVVLTIRVQCFMRTLIIPARCCFNHPSAVLLYCHMSQVRYWYMTIQAQYCYMKLE